MKGEPLSTRLIVRLRATRLERGYSQEQLGNMIGLSHSGISRIEGGERTFALDYLEDWARALGLRAELIFWRASGGIDGGASLLEETPLDEESLAVLKEVAIALPKLDRPAREALIHIVRLWRSERSDEAADKSA